MKPLDSYSFIRGVNYGLKADPAIVRQSAWASTASASG